MNSKRGAAMDTAVREQVLQLGIDENKWLLLGIPEPQQAAAIDWPRLGRTLSNLGGVDVIADCGAVSSGQPGRCGRQPTWWMCTRAWPDFEGEDCSEGTVRAPGADRR